MTARQMTPTEVGDSLTTYLADIANHELLTADDEVEVVRAGPLLGQDLAAIEGGIAQALRQTLVIRVGET